MLRKQIKRRTVNQGNHGFFVLEMKNRAGRAGIRQRPVSRAASSALGQSRWQKLEFLIKIQQEKIACFFLSRAQYNHTLPPRASFLFLK